jgi:hypothetical protein
MESVFGNRWRFPDTSTNIIDAIVSKHSMPIVKGQELKCLHKLFHTWLICTSKISIMIRIFACWAKPVFQRQITITLVLTLVGQVEWKSSPLNLFDGTVQKHYFLLTKPAILKVRCQDTRTARNRERVEVTDVYCKFMWLEFTNTNLWAHYVWFLLLQRHHTTENSDKSQSFVKTPTNNTHTLQDGGGGGGGCRFLFSRRPVGCAKV